MPATTRAIRLNLEQAAGEFGLDRKTLRKRIRQAGIEPGQDGKFSIRQMCEVVFGDLTTERLRKTRAERELLEIELAKTRNEVIHRERLFEFLQNIFIAVKSKITSSHLSEAEQNAILNDLVSLKDADL